MMKIAGSGSEPDPDPLVRAQRHGSTDPDPHQNVMDPQHWLKVVIYHSSDNITFFKAICVCSHEELDMFNNNKKH